MTNLPATYCMDPDRYNHSYPIFLYLLVKLSEISFLGYMSKTLTWTLKATPHCTYIICTIPILFVIPLILFFIWNTWHSFFRHLPWTLPIPANNTDHHSCFFFFSWFFLYFFSIFYPELQMFLYLDMHTGPWKHPLTPSPTIPYFLLNFSLFYFCFFI